LHGQATERNGEADTEQGQVGKNVYGDL